MINYTIKFLLHMLLPNLSFWLFQACMKCSHTLLLLNLATKTRKKVAYKKIINVISGKKAKRLYKNCPKSTGIWQKKRGLLWNRGLPTVPKRFSPMVELNTMKVTMYWWATWKLWISLSCLIWVIPQSMQGMFLNTTTGSSEKAAEKEYILKFSHYL